MKVLLINGSPNRKGCTHTALSEVAVALNHSGIKTEILWVGNKSVPGCIACGKCRMTGQCCFDDQVNKVAARLDEFDGFVFGSPVHYASASGAMTSFLDRLFFSASDKMELKPGASVVSCRRGGASAAFDQLNKYFTINNMPVVSSRYWNQVHGNTPEEVKQDIEGIQTMHMLGDNMAWLLKCIETGRKNGVKDPVYEQPQLSTNFIR